MIHDTPAAKAKAAPEPDEVMGSAMPAQGMTIRDHATTPGISIGRYREAFQQLLDRIELSVVVCG